MDVVAGGPGAVVGKRQRRSPSRYDEYECDDAPMKRAPKRAKRVAGPAPTALELLLQAATMASFSPPPVKDASSLAMMALALNGVQTIPRSRAKKSHTIAAQG